MAKGKQAELPIGEESGEQSEISQFQQDNGLIVFKLVNTKRKGGVYIPGIDDVKNPKTGKVERMRLLSGVDTIWVKEQKDIDESYIRQNLRSIQFPKGQKIIQVDPSDHTLLEFARLTKHNVGDPSKRKGTEFEFFEYNPQKEAEEALERELFEFQMQTLANNQDETTMRKHAAYLGIMLSDEYGYVKPTAKIRQEYISQAKKNPKRFKETVGSKKVEVSYLVRKAISENKIDISSADGNVKWGSGIYIAKLPARTNPIDYLTDLALTNTESGVEFKEQLEAVIQ